MEKLPLLKVRLFGTERITYGETPIFYGRNSVTKAVKLFLILLHCGENGIARNTLLENLYGREELANSSNNLRVTVHRLKKMLVEAGLPEYEYIVSKGGKYYWDSPMAVEVDTQLFKELIASAELEEDCKERMQLLKRACHLYGGEFLQKMSGDEWVLMESVQYKQLYEHALEEVCEYLIEHKEYEEALALAEAACVMYPFDEWQSIKMDCYIGMNRYKDALREYEETAKMLIEELGVTPSERLMKQFQMMSEHISSRPQAIGEIKGGLQESAEEGGAFFCTLPGFRDAYRVVRRGMERNGQSVFLLLGTLVDSQGRPMGNSERLEEMSEELYYALKASLRRSDFFTRYNSSQYLVLLIGTNEENCQIVIDRIKKNFTKNHKTWSAYLECSVSSIYDMDM